MSNDISGIFFLILISCHVHLFCHIFYVTENEIIGIYVISYKMSSKLLIRKKVDIIEFSSNMQNNATGPSKIIFFSTKKL